MANLNSVLPKLILIFLTISLSRAQEFNFPTDEAEGTVNITGVLVQLRGTSVYEKYVDNIISKGISKLTLAVDRATIKDNERIGGRDNIVFSPVSIAGALALVLLGANGKTFDEIATVMGLATGVDIHNRSQQVHEQLGRVFGKLEKTSGFDLKNQLRVANALFVQDEYPIRSVYKKTGEALYRSEILNLDFMSNAENAKKVINAWVSDRTDSKIKSILEELPDEDTKVMIASALYFKAEWEMPFIDGATKRHSFYPNGRNGDDRIQVDMMANGGDFPYYKDTQLDCEIMGFPYKGNKTTMYVILPNNSTKQKLLQLENALTPTDLERLVNSTKDVDAVVLFPKMKIENTIGLREILKSLGVKSLFSPATANLALLSPGTEEVQPLSVINNLSSSVKNPIVPYIKSDAEEVLIFSRIGTPVNCTEIFDPESNANKCKELLTSTRSSRKQPKQFNKPKPEMVETLDNIRKFLNDQPNPERAENPGLYANTVIHKVYMDITESGTEAAAVTLVGIAKSSPQVMFRVDVPFLFFIWHEETKMVLFWGSMTVPTPSFR